MQILLRGIRWFEITIGDGTISVEICFTLYPQKLFHRCGTNVDDAIDLADFL